MAEAFGIAAGILQVASVGTEVGTALWRCAKKLQNATKELETIANEVKVTALSLRRVVILLEDPATKALHTDRLLEDTDSVAKNCLDVFRELENSIRENGLNSNSLKVRLFSRGRWLLDSGKLGELGRLLQHYRAVLHLMISVMSIAEARRTAYVHFSNPNKQL